MDKEFEKLVEGLCNAWENQTDNAEVRFEPYATSFEPTCTASRRLQPT